MISHCDAKHQCLRQDDDTAALPTHVIEILNDFCSVRLKNGSGLNGRYICLSHCWGSHQPLQTTVQTLQGHLRAIPWQTLPVVYRETVELAQKLRVRYVWIDSLCIVQDDKNDWLRESQVMCDIYENAYLTVAATSSPDCSVSMWHCFNGGATAPTARFQGISAAGESYELLATRSTAWERGEAHPRQDTPAERRREVWPLLDRAWVFQERMLSARVLHFTANELVWECKEETTCECGDMQPNAKDELFHSMLETGTDHDLAAVWREMVQAYSGLCITYRSDRFPALSGLAQKFARKRTAARYLAGLWSTSLAADLIWYRDDDQMSEEKPEYGRTKVADPATSEHGQGGTAPSWSWAAVDGEISFASGSSLIQNWTRDTKCSFDEVYVTVNSAECATATSDPTGQVLGGAIELSGRVWDGFLEMRRNAAEPANIEYILTIDGRGVVTNRNSQYKVNLHLDSLNNPVSLAAESTNSKSNSEATNGSRFAVICLPMALVTRNTPSRSSVSFNYMRAYCMILTPNGRAGREYRRLGMAWEARTTSGGEAEPLPEESWETRPSCFSWGGRLDTITIV